MPKIQNIYTVIANKKLCPRFYCLTIAAPALAKSIRPGQFIHIRVNNGLEPFFRRPFSIYRAQKHVEVFYEPIGVGTRALEKKKPGDVLDILGPLGNTFTLPGKKIEHVVFVAGGIGVAPFLILSDALKKNKNLRMTLLYGGRTKDHVFDLKEFKKNGCVVHVATDDGSVGIKGRVSKLFAKIPLDPEKTFLYTCGPMPMMAALQAFARQNGLRGQAACEEVMACGLGACLGCSIRTTEGYRTVCHDGPVFDLDKVIFEH